MYMKIANTLRERGYDVEADMAEKDAEEVKSKIIKQDYEYINDKVCKGHFLNFSLQEKIIKNT